MTATTCTFLSRCGQCVECVAEADGHDEQCNRVMNSHWLCAPNCTSKHTRRVNCGDAACCPQLATGTGRHSREELQAALCIHTAHGWRCVPGCRSHLTSPVPPLVPPDEVLLAQRDAALDALERLVAALPERLAYEHSHDSLRVLTAMRVAMAMLAEHGLGGGR